MNTKNLVTAVALFFPFGAAMADCPTSLPTELIVDCVVATNAGNDYPVLEKLAEWQQKQAQNVQADLKVAVVLAADRK